MIEVLVSINILYHEINVLYLSFTANRLLGEDIVDISLKEGVAELRSNEKDRKEDRRR